MLRLGLQVALVGIALAGCATPYQPNGILGGYDEIQLSADVFRVSVQGNGYTSSERARRIALMRASDITVEKGYERFVVLDGDSSLRAGESSTTVSRVGGMLFGSTNTVQRPESSVTFRLVKKGSPDYDKALDAKLIAAQLRTQLS